MKVFVVCFLGGMGRVAACLFQSSDDAEAVVCGSNVSVEDVGYSNI